MSQGTHADIHREHQAWSSEAALWRDEVALWRAEAQTALAEIERLAEAVRDDLQALTAHEASLCMHLGRADLHEHALAEFAAMGRADDLLVLGKQHRGESARHAACSQTHQELKHLHQAVMQDWLRGPGDAIKK